MADINLEPKIRNSFRFSAIRHVVKCVRLLPIKSRFFFLSVVFFQAIASALDLVGLALIINLILGMQNSSGGQVSNFIGKLPFLAKIISKDNSDALLLFVVIVFIAKGILAMLLHKLNLKLFARATDKLVNVLSGSIFENRANRFRNFTVQDISFIIFNATEIVFKDTLLPFTVILSDTILVFLIALNLYLSVATLFVPCVLYFALIFLFLWKSEKKKTKDSYKTQLHAEIQSRNLILETDFSLRELLVSDKLRYFINRITSARHAGITAGSEIAIAQLRPKYVYEMALFGGIGIMALTARLSGNQSSVLIFITMFVISASRMIPSLMRIQFYSATFRKSKEQSARIFEVLDMRALANESDNRDYLVPRSNTQFSPEIVVTDLNFSYLDDAPLNTITDIRLTINPGEVLAVVGPSGAGKSTFVDLLLGYLDPKTGSVRISGLPPRIAFQNWPGEIAYVPQNIAMYDATLLGNIAVGETNLQDSQLREKVIALLKDVGLEELLHTIENGLDSNLGEFGSSLSGGQIQRIGIARALLSEPKILVLDEATSSLDSATENEIMDLLLGYRGKKTLILIAHRLSTIKTADRIIYIDKGKIEAEGNFENLRTLVPAFEKQVNFLGVEKPTSAS